MEDFYTNISQNGSFNHSDTPYDYYNYYDYYFYNYYDCTYVLYDPFYYYKIFYLISMMTYLISGISLPLILVAIIVLYSMIRNDHVAPIYVINFLISSVIQLCCMIAEVTPFRAGGSFDIYGCALTASVGFMVCIALESYLVIACPLWYQFKRTIKTSVVVCVLVWSLCLIYVIASYFLLDCYVRLKISFVFLLLPFPLFIFFLVGTIKALSGSVSVPSDEKRRIVGVSVLVLLIYTLLYLPTVILWCLYTTTYNIELIIVSEIFIRLSPLADLLLFIFMRKGS